MELSCPTCAKALNDWAPLDPADEGKLPSKGDLSLCVYCASFLMFEQDGGATVRLMTLEEIAALDDDMRIMLLRVRRVIDRLRKARGGQSHEHH